MIRLMGSKQTCFCDGHTRRLFLQAGFLGLGGLSLPQLLEARSQKGVAAKKTSVIYIELTGGPTQFETYDPKPEAPSEYRGPFGTVRTNLPGVHFSELMKEQAKVADKMAIIRKWTSLRHILGIKKSTVHRRNIHILMDPSRAKSEIRRRL